MITDTIIQFGRGMGMWIHWLVEMALSRKTISFDSFMYERGYIKIDAGDFFVGATYRKGESE